ncbi:hypothetical protein [Inquilinus sp. OTU3971]|uniref:hypothetical protein n=1 Tax=Inquilinus sp. OTU3971 TaxID=3043855 RepID=UPI00313D7053
MSDFTIDLRDATGSILEACATSSNLYAAHGAYEALVARYPEKRYTLRQGVHVMRDSHPEPAPPPVDCGPGGWGELGPPPESVKRSQHKRRWK